MDLSLKAGDVILNVRVACIIRTANGFLFESSPNCTFLVGGRVMANETSLNAALREIKEEIGVEVKDATLVALLENFYNSIAKEGKVHELCFVYKIDPVFNGPIPEGFVEIQAADLDKFDVRPQAIVDLLKKKDSGFQHMVVK
jgi:8-oxo-dGTP pyrophosphatase MutT (NUDIX family)